MPQYILEAAITDEHGADCNIICTQPRRVSAVGLAARVAQVRHACPLLCRLGTTMLPAHMGQTRCLAAGPHIQQTWTQALLH